MRSLEFRSENLTGNTKLIKKYDSAILKKEKVMVKTRKTTPKYAEIQINVQKNELRQLSKNEFSLSNELEFIIDDKPFSTLEGSNTANNRHYYC